MLPKHFSSRQKFVNPRPSRVCFVLGVLLCTFACSAVRSAPVDSWQTGLLLYAPLDGDIEPAIAKGSEVASGHAVAFTDGVAGRGAQLLGGALHYFAAGNFNAARGSISFWCRTSWRRKAAEATPVYFRAGHVQLASSKPGKLFFMTGKTKKKEGFRWDYSVQTRIPRNWNEEHWHHIAVTWDADSGRKNLFLDGSLAASGTTERINPQNPRMGRHIRLNKQHAPGGYDEIMIWDRVLSTAEIRVLFNAPDKVAGILSGELAGDPRTYTATEWPLEFEIKRMLPVDTIVKPGETASVPVLITNPAPLRYRGEITFSLLDFWLSVSNRKVRTIDLAGGETRTIELEFTPPEKGVYKVEAALTRNDRQLARDVGTFAAWPEPNGPPDPDSFFGNHVHAWSGGKFLRQAARLGQTWMRNHNMLQTTWWVHAEPEPGQFEWKYDFQLDHIKRHRMPVLGQLFATPGWAAQSGPKPPSKGYPKNWNPKLAALGRYVRRTVTRYKDYIHHWEVWNEPGVGIFWRGTPEEFGEMCQVACRAVKEADPQATVMVGGFTSPAWRWHRKAAQAGALKYVDAISFHYGCPLKPPEAVYEELQAVTDHFQSLARDYGPGHEVPLWNTEGGCPDTTWLRGLDYPELPPPSERPPMNWRKGAISVVRGEAILQSLGVKRHFIYLQNAVKEGPRAYEHTSMLEVNNAPRPKLMARVAMAAQLDWTEHTALLRRPEGRFWAHVYGKKREPGTVVLFWCGENGKVRLNADFSDTVTRYVDIMGNSRDVAFPLTVTWEPAYLHIDAPPRQVVEALENASLTIVRKAFALKENDDKSAQVPPLPDYVAPSENPSAAYTVDLRPYCNMGFKDEAAGDGRGGWSDEGPMNDMRDFPTGTRTWYGVTFDIIEPEKNEGRAVITLQGSGATPTLPREIKGIKVGRKARVLYFLHAAAWGAPGVIGEYLIHYADGTTAKVPNRIPLNNMNWWNGYHEDEISRPVPVRVTNTSRGKPAWRYVRVFEWENPHKDKRIASIDAVSLGEKSSPILIAISGVGTQ